MPQVRDMQAMPRATKKQAHAVRRATEEAVVRARAEVNGFREQVARHVRADAKGDAADVAQGLRGQVDNADALVGKAEVALKRIKDMGVVPPRPTARVPQAVRAKRALSVLQGGGVSGDWSASPEKKRRVLSRGGLLPRARLGAATPLRVDQLSTLIKQVAIASKLRVAIMDSLGVGFECLNVFRAYIWFTEIDDVDGPRSDAQASVSPALALEHVSVFGADDSRPSRWSCSKHAVFNILTERANVAARYFQLRENSVAAAFVALVAWLALHKTLFSEKCEANRLAFDASRGVFLPPCVWPFDSHSHGAPRFTRGSIPALTKRSVRSPKRGSDKPASQAGAAAKSA